MELIKGPVMEKDTVIRLPARMDTITRLDIISSAINQGLAWLAAVSLLMMMLVVVGAALTRKFFTPFTGSTEIVGWLAALTTGFALGYTQVKRGYVDIDTLVELIPQGLQKFLRCFMFFLSLLFFAMVTWQITLYGLGVFQKGNLSETLWLPYYPLIFSLSLGFGGLTLALLVDLLKELSGGAGK